MCLSQCSIFQMFSYILLFPKFAPGWRQDTQVLLLKGAWDPSTVTSGCYCSFLASSAMAFGCLVVLLFWNQLLKSWTMSVIKSLRSVLSVGLVGQDLGLSFDLIPTQDFLAIDSFNNSNTFSFRALVEAACTPTIPAGVTPSLAFGCFMKGPTSYSSLFSTPQVTLGTSAFFPHYLGAKGLRRSPLCLLMVYRMSV